MVKATPAPKVSRPELLFWPYVYAATLGGMAVVQLMGVSGFDFAHIKYQTAGAPGMIIIIAAIEIFALPFLLRLSLSPLARFFSAIFAFTAPLFIVANFLYVNANTNVPYVQLATLGYALFFILDVASFTILDGKRALRFPKK